ncbi:glycosyltransferase [Prevotella brunnea]|uniref:Glycosyltransferase n=1 Tax=Prevotella brunnea TaxID=2508867 RepID=A0A5C8GLF3_9BACT|nr:glycosyltransferase family 4 protein [Prevotella brunnea]MDR0185098.1 glycosyltransferase [Prevotella brunnea]TXJ62796.1 glycosyltransferase [Prevotella brunnea]
MRVLIVNTSEKTGGAAVAANRLKDALNHNGVKAKMLVRDKLTDDITVVGLKGRWRNRLRFLWERWCVFWNLRFSRTNLFALDIANAGADITSLPEFKEADIIHLSWINQGMLSLSGIRKILESGKPVVWTLHDLWPISSICHLSLDCRRFETCCSHCQYLPGGGSEHDLAYRVWMKKAKLYKEYDISFVACSRWLAREAEASGLLADQTVSTVPNPINTHLFKPGDKAVARKACGLPTGKRLILFVAQRATNVNKGMHFLVDACNRLVDADSGMSANTAIVILGGRAEDFEGQFRMPVFPMGYISDENKIVNIYNAVDVFVLPSLSENLPNTIMEAMACGVPCVGFNVGGIPEMIDHRVNGYVAQAKDSIDLARGIRWILDEANGNELSVAALSKVLRTYSRHRVAGQYIEIYDQALAMKNYQI